MNESVLFHKKKETSTPFLGKRDLSEVRRDVLKVNDWHDTCGIR